MEAIVHPFHLPELTITPTTVATKVAAETGVVSTAVLPIHHQTLHSHLPFQRSVKGGSKKCRVVTTPAVVWIIFRLLVALWGGSEGVQPGVFEPASSAPKALNGVFEWASAMLQTTGLTSSSTSSEERSSIDPHHSHLTQPDIMEKGSSKKPGSLLTNNYNHNSNNNNNKSKDSFNNKNIGNRRNKRISSSSSSRGNTRNPQALGGVKVGDFVHWAHADHDIPLGAVGLVAGFTKDTARAKCRFPNGTFALRPNTLVMKCLIPELLLQHLNFFLLLERVAILKNVWCFCACLLPQLSRFSPCLLISSGNLCCSCRRNHHHGVLKAYRRRILVLLCTTISTVA